jgi:cob(I)alamin adenosyltransferase
VNDVANNTIYTRTGDDGTTPLMDGERVAKSHERIEAYGTLEELNACVGVTLEHLRTSPPAILYRIAPCLSRVQHELLNLNSEVATPVRAHEPSTPVVEPWQVQKIESMIDRCQAEVPPLRGFPVPGGGLVAAHLHLCRAVARRAERDVLRLAQRESVRPETLGYLNRLSDLFLALARWSHIHSGEAEHLWDPDSVRNDTLEAEPTTNLAAHTTHQTDD